MKKIKAKVTYKVPSWEYCNLQSPLGQPAGKDKCRFCVDLGRNKGHTCVMHNSTLNTVEGNLQIKCLECKQSMKGWGVTSVVDVPETSSMPRIEVSDVAANAVKKYKDVVADLIKNGYPPEMALSAAEKYLLT